MHGIVAVNCGAYVLIPCNCKLFLLAMAVYNAAVYNAVLSMCIMLPGSSDHVDK